MLWTGLILGLVSSFHCVGMCGPIAFLLPIDRSNKTKATFQVFSYHLGRICAYLLIGLVIGLLGKGVDLLGVQQYFSIAIGIGMLLFVTLPFTARKLKFNIGWYHKLLSKLKSQIGLNLKNKSMDTFLSLGFLNGFLPCGMVYIAAFTALTLGDVGQGSLYMLLFGLGTIPLMTAVVFLRNAVTPFIKRKLKNAAPIVIAVMACLLIVRGLGLGIAYLSPAKKIDTISAAQECHPDTQPITLKNQP